MTGEAEHQTRGPLTEVERAALDQHFAQWQRWISLMARRWAVALHLDADELHADIVAELVARFPWYDPRWNFGTFVRIVARSVACRTARSAGRHIATVRPFVRGEDGSASFIDLAPDRDGPDPAAEAARAEVRGRVAAAVEALPADQRAAVRRRLLTDDAPRLRGREREHFDAALAALRAELAAVAADR